MRAIVEFQQTVKLTDAVKQVAGLSLFAQLRPEVRSILGK